VIAVHPRILLATTGRILRQLRHDHRTIALFVGVPTLLLTLIYYMFDRQPERFDGVALIMLGIFPFVIMFLVTSIAMLRERNSGTLERLLTSPMGRLDLLFGYGLAFGLAAAVQAGIACGSAYWLFGLHTAGSPSLVVLIAVLNALLGVAIGLLCSAFARTEFQAVQFMPLIAVPQLLLCGLFVSYGAMARWLQIVSDFLPLTYAVRGLQEVGMHPSATAEFGKDVGIVSGCVVIALALASATLRRRSA
jgi:ABC-2 type transport system permease protein